MRLTVYPLAPKSELLFWRNAQGIIQLLNVGVITNLSWSEIVNHAINLELGKFVAMPHHVHRVFILDNSDSIGTLHDHT
jgi:hypothetical protein